MKRLRKPKPKPTNYLGKETQAPDTKMNRPLLGAHVSISGGVDQAMPRALELGCTAFQIFTKNATQWRPRPLLAREIDSFRASRGSFGRYSIMAHNGYLINLAHPDKMALERSRRALIQEMDRAETLGIPYLVIHPGAHLGSGEKRGLQRIVRSIEQLFDNRRGPSGTAILLETTAGQGTVLGYRFEQLAWIIEHSRHQDKLGVCFDTCHSFAAGYELRDRESFHKTFREFDRIIGLDRLKAFHLNDSQGTLGSRLDRHEHIGKGQLGLKPFEWIMKDERFIHIPKIIETPKSKNGLEADRQNLRVLLSLTYSGAAPR